MDGVKPFYAPCPPSAPNPIQRAVSQPQLPRSRSDGQPIESSHPEALKEVNIDRPQHFIARVHLAKVQHLFAAGDFPASQKAFVRMIMEHEGKIGGSKFNDFIDLI